MAETTEELLVKIRADLSELKAGMAGGAKIVKDGAAGMEQAYDKVRGKVSLLNQAYGQFQTLLAATGVALVNRAIHNSLEYAESLKTVALRVGLTTDALQEWRYAAGQQGLAQETLDSALSKFNITLGKARTEGAAAAGVFQRLGLEVKGFANNDEALQAVTQRLRDIKDPAQRAAMAFQIFGREAGPKFAEFLTKDAAEFAKLRKEAHELGAVLDEQTIEKAKKAQDQLAALSQITKTQATKALVDLAPVVIGVGQALSFSAEKLNEFIKGWRYLLGSVDEPVFDPMAEQFKGLNAQIEVLERRLKLARATMEERGQFTWYGADRKAAIDQLVKQLEELRAKHVALQQEAFKGIPANRKAAVPAAAPTGGFELQRTEEENEKIEKLETDLQNRLLQLRAAGADAQMGYIRKTKTFTEENEAKEIELMAQSFAMRKAMVDADAKARIETLSKLKLSEEERLKYEQDIYAAAELQKTQLTEQNEQARQDIRNAYAEERIQKTLEELRRVDDAEMNSRRIREEEARREQNSFLEWIGIEAENVSRLHSFEVMSTQEKGQAIAQLTKDLANTMAGQSKKAFEVAKAASIAQTIIDTYAAAQAAYKAMAGIPYVGPALGIAAAAAAIASGVARVNAIKSTTFGSRSVSSTGGGGVAGTSPGQASAGGGPGGPSIYINMPAGNNFYSGDFIRDLIKRISEAQGDGSRIQVTS